MNDLYSNLSPEQRRMAIAQYLGGIGQGLGGLQAAADPLAAWGRGISTGLGSLESYVQQINQMERQRAAEERARQAFEMQQQRFEWEMGDRDWELERRMRTMEDAGEAEEREALYAGELAVTIGEEMDRVLATAGPNSPAYRSLELGLSAAKSGQVRDAMEALEAARKMEVGDLDREDRQAHARQITSAQQAGRSSKPKVEVTDELVSFLANRTEYSEAEVRTALESGMTANQIAIRGKKGDPLDERLAYLEDYMDQLNERKKALKGYNPTEQAEIDAKLAEAQAEYDRIVQEKALGLTPLDPEPSPVMTEEEVAEWLLKNIRDIDGGG